MLLTDPDQKLKIYALTTKTEDVEKAIRAAWQQIDPTFNLKVNKVDQPPAPNDIEKVVGITMPQAMQPDHKGVGQLYKGVTYLLLFDLDLVSAQKRTSQLAIIQSGFKITAFAQTDLSKVKPLTINATILTQLDGYIVDALKKFNIPVRQS